MFLDSYHSKMNGNISWDDHRYFLAIARARSLTGASKVLGVSQPTVSRRLEAMEKSRNAELFHRTRVGYELTPVGAELFEAVCRVEEQLNEADRNILGRDSEITGALRFTSTEIFINGYLGQHIWAFLREHKEIELRLVCTQSTLSISRREADIAVRFAERPPDTLIGRRLGTVAYSVYAAVDQVEAFAGIENGKSEWIGMHDEAFNRMLYGTFLPSTRPKHRTDSMAAMQAMVRAGLGVSILPCYAADPDPALVRLIDRPFTDPKFDIWLVYHPDTRRTRRLRLFADFVINRIRADIDLFEGRHVN
jgi:DNA-binding transcriptional LysR family regulator